MPFARTRLAAALAGALSIAAAPAALAAGFALQENNASGLGNAYAGGAAAAEDASTVWWNPAGMSRLKQRETVAALHLITPSNRFRDEGSIAAFNQPLGGDGGNAGGLNVVPNAYLVIPYNQDIALGVGVNAPFGLTTEYDDGWIGRYHGLKSQVKTINVQPSISWKASPEFSVGLGVDFQWLDADLTSNANYSGAIATGAQQAAAAGQIPASLVPQIIAATPGLDSFVRVKGDDTTWGWNIGVLWEPSPTTRVGAHYRSEMKYTVKGDVDFDHPALPANLPPALAPVVATIANGVNRALYDGDVTSRITLPQIANVSLFHQIDSRWDIMADIQWTGWSSIKDLTFVRVEGPVLSSTPENFEDVWRFSVGANYRVDDKWMLRGGVAYDESPVIDIDRTPRLPDENRTWLTFGAQYKVSPSLILDAGFAYIWVSDASIDTNAGSTAQFGLVKGRYDSSVTIFSVQAAYRF
jgi:long-chain fatty acid transport protein